MIKAYFPPYDEVPVSEFKITPEIEKKLEGYKVDAIYTDVSKAPKTIGELLAAERESHQRKNTLDTGESFEVSISKVLNNVRQLLLDKNRKYGNSALEPKRIFSKSNAVEQIKVRIDDKLSRLMSGQLDDTEDVELDLLGYLVLLQVAKIS